MASVLRIVLYGSCTSARFRVDLLQCWLCQAESGDAQRHYTQRPVSLAFGERHLILDGLLGGGVATAVVMQTLGAGGHAGMRVAIWVDAVLGMSA